LKNLDSRLRGQDERGLSQQDCGEGSGGVSTLQIQVVPGWRSHDQDHLGPLPTVDFTPESRFDCIRKEVRSEGNTRPIVQRWAISGV